MASSSSTLKGSLLGIILHDVCEEIRLEELRSILDAKRTPTVFKHATPEMFVSRTLRSSKRLTQFCSAPVSVFSHR